MLNKINLKNILFLDVETVPMVAQYDELSDTFKQLWENKALKIKTQDEKTPEDLFFEKAGVYSEFGKIVCISAGFFHGEKDDLKFRCKAFWTGDEKTILTDFAALLNDHFSSQDHYLCGHNAKEFDFPFIARRMLINQVPLPDILNIPGRKPWENCLLDTMELWKFGDYKNYTSLALLAAVFGIPSPKDDIAGSDVAKVFWQLNDPERIAVYCNKDVVTTARLFLKYTMQGELHEESIDSIV
jgi:3'-5' exonuclease